MTNFDEIFKGMKDYFNENEDSFKPFKLNGAKKFTLSHKKTKYSTEIRFTCENDKNDEKDSVGKS